MAIGTFLHSILLSWGVSTNALAKTPNTEATPVASRVAQNVSVALQANKAKKKKKKGKKPLHIPIEVGVGPAGFNFTGLIGDNQFFHSGLSISGEAILSRKVLKQNKHMIPKQYRKMVLSQREMRISKLWIPDSLIISPALNGTSVYGASFRPISLGLISPRNNRGLSASVGARATYAYIASQDEAIGTTHFLRVGLDGRAEFRIPIGKKKWLGLGWASHLYIPQTVGGAVGDLDIENVDLASSIWHVGHAFVKYYYRFPYKVTL